jgi:putative flippase GtrA
MGLLRSIRAHREVRRAAKYGIVGMTNLAIDFTVYAILVLVGVWYPAAKTIAFVIATANGYTLNRLWTFRAGAHRGVILTRYAVVQVSGLLVNLALLVVLVEVVGVSKIAAQALVLPFVAAGTFLAQRIWTFGHVTR